MFSWFCWLVDILRRMAGQTLAMLFQTFLYLYLLLILLLWIYDREIHKKLLASNTAYSSKSFLVLAKVVFYGYILEMICPLICLSKSFYREKGRVCYVYEQWSGTESKIFTRESGRQGKGSLPLPFIFHILDMKLNIHYIACHVFLPWMVIIWVKLLVIGPLCIRVSFIWLLDNRKSF